MEQEITAGRKRKYASNAERQKVYRERQARKSNQRIQITLPRRVAIELKQQAAEQSVSISVYLEYLIFRGAHSWKPATGTDIQTEN